MVVEGRRIGIILAGGSGFLLFKHKRFYPILPAEKHPYSKCACILGNRRTIDFPIEALKKADVKEHVYINVFTNYETLKNYPGIAIHRQQGMKIEWYDENNLYGTAGSIKNICKHPDFNLNIQDKDLVISQNGDIVHNFDLTPIIKAHEEQAELEKKPGLTAVFIRVNDWNMMKHYGSVQIKGMVDRGDMSREKYEEYVDDWYRETMAKGDRYFKVANYGEKYPRDKCFSNLTDVSIYIMSGSLVREICNLITDLPKKGEKEIEGKYHYDFSRHTIPWIIENKDKYFFYAYIMPEQEERKKNFFLDIGTREKLWQGNMAVLNGDIDVGLKSAEGILWHERTWGWEGKNVKIGQVARSDFNVAAKNVDEVWKVLLSGGYIDESGVIQPSFDGKYENFNINGIDSKLKDDVFRILQQKVIDASKGIKNSILCDDVTVKNGVKIDNCVIGAGATIEEDAKLNKVVVFPSYTKTDPTVIGDHSYLEKVTVLGGRIDPRTGIVGKGGEILYVPKGGVITLPVMEDADLLVDEKKARVLEELPSMKELALICFGGMSDKHLACATPERLSNQIKQINGLLERLKTMDIAQGGSKCVIEVSNKTSPDAAEIMIATSDKPGILDACSDLLGRKISIKGSPFSLSIKTDWNITKDNTAVLIFEVTDAEDKNLTDEVLAEVKNQLEERINKQ